MSEPRRRGSSLLFWLIPLSVVVFAGGCLAVASTMHFNIGPTPSTLPPPPPPSEYGTASEVGTRGDVANPRELFHGAFPSDGNTQERRVGGLPARFSGYTTWVRSITYVPARTYVDVYPGQFLRVRVTVFNRDTQTQHVCACDFFVWTRSAGLREADAVAARSLSRDAEMRSGARRDGNVYLYVGTVPGPYYVVYNPDAHVPEASSSARGVWRVPS
jgi:hypothetical protein